MFFDRLVALGSITAVAREMEVPKATASRWLAALEARVGETLVRRTTRHVGLTERGRSFHARIGEVITAVRQAQSAVQSTEPTGTVRVSVPVPLGRLVGGSVIASFRRQLPRVRLEIALENRRIDLVRDAFDVAIRGGPLPDSNMIGRRLAKVPLWLYASVEYADADPTELPIIGAPGDENLLTKRRRDLARPSVVVDDRSAVADALVCGAGAGALPAFLGEPARRNGDIVRCDETPLAVMDVHAVYLPTLRRDVRIGVLIDAVEAELGRIL